MNAIKKVNGLISQISVSYLPVPSGSILRLGGGSLRRKFKRTFPVRKSIFQSFLTNSN